MWSNKTLTSNEGSQDLSAGSLTLDYTPTRDAFVHSVGIGFDGAVSQTVVLTLISSTGAAYATQLDSTALSSATKYAYKPSSPIAVPSGWTLRLTCTNTSTPAVVASAAMVTQER